VTATRRASRRAPLGAWLRVAWALLWRPALWWPSLRQLWRLAPAGWWRRPPFLPVPSRDYLRFRMETQNGDSEHAPDPADVLNYLSWCRAWDRAR